MISDTTIFYILAIVVGISLWFDLFKHKNTTFGIKSAALWSVFWVAISLGFYLMLLLLHSAEYANLFLAGYALEKSLSVDNLFVFSAIFMSFKITEGEMQRRILYIGILSALVFRAIFIFFGTALFHMSSYMEILFGMAVIVAAYMVFASDGDEEETDHMSHWSVRLTRRWLPIDTSTTQRLMTRPNTKKAWFGYMFTPAFLCLVCIEVSDILFSFDSIPAIIAVTSEPILVYSCVVFAICGLRSLYFLLDAAASQLVYLAKAIGILLVFVGMKLITTGLHHTFGTPHLEISPGQNVLIVISVLGVGVLASFLAQEKHPDQPAGGGL